VAADGGVVQVRSTQAPDLILVVDENVWTVLIDAVRGDRLGRPGPRDQAISAADR